MADFAMAGVPYPDKADSLITRHPGLAGKRIALFSGAYNHIADGVSLTLNRLVAYLERHGAEVLVFAPTIDDPPVDHAGTLVPIRSLPFPGYADYRVSLGLPKAAERRLDAFGPDLFHIATADFLGRRAVRLAEMWGTPVVASYHTHFTSYLKYYNISFTEGFWWWYLRWFHDHCIHTYVPSESMAEVLHEHGIADGLRLWKRGVDTNLFNPKRRSLAWRRSLGVADNEVIVTFVGRLVWEKGLDTFAGVIESLKARGVPHRSMMIGDGPAYDDMAQRLPDTLFTGYLEPNELARAYASSDVFLFPSETETFGNVTLEAMASGLPTVCADATGSRSLVHNNVTGFLACPSDPNDFADHVEQLIIDDDLRHRLGHNALDEAHTYRWDAVLAQITCYYEEILAPSLAPCGDGAQNGQTAPDFSVSDEMLLPSS